MREAPTEYNSPHSIRSYRPTAASKQAWVEVREALKPRLKGAAFPCWIEPLECVGESGDALVLMGHPVIAKWVRRRYGVLIGETVRDLTDYRGVYIEVSR